MKRKTFRVMAVAILVAVAAVGCGPEVDCGCDGTPAPYETEPAGS